jgi:endonuclease V-like protein UPF0215 family
LTPQRIRQVKREIRVLGVAVRRDANGYIIIGIVYRGNLWLDGALMAHSDSDDLTTAIADMLAGSPHSGQVRVILLNRHNLPSEARIDASELSSKAGKPIIILGDGALWVWKMEGKEIHYTAEGLGRWTAEAVLRASTRECVTPEALRVAALTLSALT